MSSRTWTPGALASEARRLSGRCWRAVEAQHKVSTLKLVDTLAEQAILESLIETSKPPIPPECRGLHYLLATPFRYGAPYPQGSRFRRAGMTAGVFYASERVETAITELAFHRLLFFAESPETPWPLNAGEFTSFAANYSTAHGLDLNLPPLDADSATWRHQTDYAPCQSLAEAARYAAFEVIRYASARDRNGVNIALLTCRAFRSPRPAGLQTWRIQFGASGVRAICEFPQRRLELTRAAFHGDPRIARLRWNR